MTGTPEPRIESSSVAEESLSTKPNRLRRALTWVGIVAGSVLIVGGIFVAGAATGWLPAWHSHHEPQAISMPHKGDPPMPGDKCCCDKK
jgi:hypothetical protein